MSGSVLAFSGIAACTTETKMEIEPDYSLFDLNEITIDELQQKMSSGELTSVKICQKYLDRIKHIDPVLKSVIEVNPDALEIARNLDEERKAGKIRGPLHGMPILFVSAAEVHLRQLFQDTQILLCRWALWKVCPLGFRFLAKLGANQLC